MASTWNNLFRIVLKNMKVITIIILNIVFVFNFFSKTLLLNIPRESKRLNNVFHEKLRNISRNDDKGTQLSESKFLNKSSPVAVWVVELKRSLKDKTFRDRKSESSIAEKRRGKEKRKEEDDVDIGIDSIGSLLFVRSFPAALSGLIRRQWAC